MLQQLTGSELTELLAYNYTLTKEFKDQMKRESAPKDIRNLLKHRVKKKNA